MVNLNLDKIYSFSFWTLPLSDTCYLYLDKIYTWYSVFISVWNTFLKCLCKSYDVLFIFSFFLFTLRLFLFSKVMSVFYLLIVIVVISIICLNLVTLLIVNLCLLVSSVSTWRLHNQRSRLSQPKSFCLENVSIYLFIFQLGFHIILEIIDKW